LDEDAAPSTEALAAVAAEKAEVRGNWEMKGWLPGIMVAIQRNMMKHHKVVVS